MSYKRKILDDMTDSDWVMAARYETKNSYNKMKRIAQRAGLLTIGNVHDIKMSDMSEVDQFMRGRDTERVEAYNKALMNWQDKILVLLRLNIKALGIKGNELINSLQPTNRKNKYGEINALGFSFARHGIFIYKGAYRGHGGNKGSKWSYRKKINGNVINTSQMRHTNPQSLGELTSSKMRYMDWFNPVIRRRENDLLKICLNYHDQLIIDTTHIYIKR